MRAVLYKKIMQIGHKGSVVLILTIRLGNKRDLSDFGHGMGVSVRQAGLSIFITIDHLGFSHNTFCLAFTQKDELK